jgi:hypothetical protein
MFIGPSWAETIRLATYNADLSAYGPGLLLQDLQKAKTPRYEAAIQVIAALDADVLLLTGIDYDLKAAALDALAARLAALGKTYPYRRALRPNTGVASGLDIDGNGRLGEPRDALAWGRFAGEGGMALLSRLPFAGEPQDFTSFLWADLPSNLMPDTDPARAIQPLSSAGHYMLPVSLPDGRVLQLLAFYATPPAFDGPEDRNGRRNHDESAFWLRLLAGELPFVPPAPPFAVLGQISLDPVDGGGRAEAITALMRHPMVQDPKPAGTHNRREPDQVGDPALDTALYDGLGGLRVEQILPSSDLKIDAAGVLWPPDSDPLAAVLATASRHRPVWVDIVLP